MKANKILPSEFCLQLISRNDVLHNLLHEIPSPYVEIPFLEDNLAVSPWGISNKDIFL